jgi:transposase-like protein
MAMEEITPQQIEQAALDARLTISEVCKRSGVAASTFYRAKNGEQSLRPLTAARMMDAIAGKVV